MIGGRKSSAGARMMTGAGVKMMTGAGVRMKSAGVDEG